MSHDTNTVDSRTHEGQLNKLGFWIFLTAEFSLFGTLFATLLTLQHGVTIIWQNDNRIIRVTACINYDVCLIN